MKYKCDYCEGEFEHPEAGGPKEGFAIACDDCYKCFQNEVCYKCGKPNHPGFLICDDHLQEYEVS